MGRKWLRRRFRILSLVCVRRRPSRALVCRPMRPHGHTASIPREKRLRVRVSAGFCRDGLQAAREARSARRGDPRCPDTIFWARTGEDRTSLYDEITNKIIGELEAGRVPWVQPWGTAAANASLPAMPKSAATGRQYSGINILILWGAAIERRFTGQSWLTFRQALSLGGHVRKGERGTTVVYADRFVPVDEKAGARARTVRKPRPFHSSSASRCSTRISVTTCLSEIATTAPPSATRPDRAKRSNT